MLIDVVTIFPELFGPFTTTGLVGRAAQMGIVTVRVHDLRDHTHDRHRTVDDYSYGGGAGMVMRPAPFYECVDRLTAEPPRPTVVLSSARGRLFDQATAGELASRPRMVILCGHYKGVDERVARLADIELSIGDYVLSGGELAACVVIDAVTRLLPGAVGNFDSVREDSHYHGLLSYPEYTRPAVYRGRRVPRVLLSGDHRRIEAWRRKKALQMTRARRPDLWDRHRGSRAAGSAAGPGPMAAGEKEGKARDGR